MIDRGLYRGLDAVDKPHLQEARRRPQHCQRLSGRCLGGRAAGTGDGGDAAEGG